MGIVLRLEVGVVLTRLYFLISNFFMLLAGGSAVSPYSEPRAFYVSGAATSLIFQKRRGDCE